MPKGRTVSEAENILTRATKKELEGDWQSAFQLYTKAAQILVSIYGTTEDKTEKANSKRVADIALDRAQKLKKAHPNVKAASRDPFSDGEQTDVLNASSLINGTKYPLWTDPTMEEITRPTSFHDQSQQLASSAPEWKTAREVLGFPPMIDYKMLPSELVQSIVPNCSVVASVIVCWNHHLRHNSKLMLSRLYPQCSPSIPQFSPNGRYYYKLFINGYSRRSSKSSFHRLHGFQPRLAFDDRVPMQGGQLMCMTASQSSCIWPMLVEKAYMKCNGGYDFSGSDSGADLRALVGWIPEYQALRSSSFEQERTWKTLVKAFREGSVLITLATGNEPPTPIKGQRHLSRHAYACIDLEDSDDRLLTIVNPWRQADLQPEGLPRDMAELSLDSHNPVGSETAEGHRRLSWEDVCSTFDTLCLSWNPALFPHIITHHRTWKGADKKNGLYSIGKRSHLNHQIRVSLDEDASDTEIWALLSRHVVDRDDPAVYIAVHAFEEDGNGASFVKPENLTIRGQYHESLHCLVKLSPASSVKRISFIASLYFGDATTARDVSYTLTLYSNRRISFRASPIPAMTTKQEKFNAANSGGNVSQPTYFRNPQWRIKILPPDMSHAETGHRKHTKIILRAFTRKDVPLNLKVYRTSQRRLDDSIDGQVAFDSGIYHFGLAFGQVGLPVGEYTVVLSTFASGQYGAVTLEVSSSEEFTLDRLPAEGAGMHLKNIKGRWDGASAAGGPSFKKYWDNPIFELNIDRSTDLMVRLQARSGTTVLPINISLFKTPSVGKVPTEVAASGQYRESVYGVRIKQCRVPRGVYVLVPSTYSPNLKGDFEISVWSDSPITIRQLNSPN